MLFKVARALGKNGFICVYTRKHELKLFDSVHQLKPQLHDNSTVERLCLTMDFLMQCAFCLFLSLPCLFPFVVVL